MPSATPPSHVLRQFLSTNGLPFSINGIVSDNAKSHVSCSVPLKQVIQTNQIQRRQRQKSPPRQATQTQPMCRWNSSCASSTTAPQEVEVETNQSLSLPCPPRRASSPIRMRRGSRSNTKRNNDDDDNHDDTPSSFTSASVSATTNTIKQTSTPAAFSQTPSTSSSLKMLHQCQHLDHASMAVRKKQNLVNSIAISRNAGAPIKAQTLLYFLEEAERIVAASKMYP